VDTAALRRAWPDVLGKVFTMRRTSWTLLSAHAQIADYDGATVTLSVGTPGLLATLSQGPHTEIVRQALIDVLGVDARVVGRVDDTGAGQAQGFAPPAGEAPADPASGGAGPLPPGGPTTGGGPSAGPTGSAAPSARPASSPGDRLAEIGGAGAAAAGGRGGWAAGGDWSSAPPPASSAPSWATEQVPTPSPATGAGPARFGGPAAHSGSTAEAAGPGPAGSTGTTTATAVTDAAVPEEDLVSDDDEEVDGAGEAGAAVVERLLGGTVISDDQL
jgi:DNA polymerase-3 subunit gamma/tau